jgi:hypothetical protein
VGGTGESVGGLVSVGRGVSLAGRDVAVGRGVSVGKGVGTGVVVLVNRGRRVLVGVAVMRATPLLPMVHPSSSKDRRATTIAKAHSRLFIRIRSSQCGFAA